MVKSFSKSNLLALLFMSTSLLPSCSKKLHNFHKKYSTKDLNVKIFEFDYLTIKSKIEFKETHKTTKTNAMFRLQKDSIIWFNVSGAMGVQGLRGIITKDSVKVINKIEKQYFAHDFEEIRKEFKFPINFDLIQAMLIGDMPKPIDDKRTVRKNETQYVITQNIESMHITNYVNQSSLKLEEVNITEKETDNSMKLLYKNFMDISGQGLPFSIFISLIHHNEFGELETQLTLEHTKAEESDKSLNFQFTVPKKYEVK